MNFKKYSTISILKNHWRSTNVANALTIHSVCVCVGDVKDAYCYISQ